MLCRTSTATRVKVGDGLISDVTSQEVVAKTGLALQSMRDLNQALNCKAEQVVINDLTSNCRQYLTKFLPEGTFPDTFRGPVLMANDDSGTIDCPIPGRVLASAILNGVQLALIDDGKDGAPKPALFPSPFKQHMSRGPNLFQQLIGQNHFDSECVNLFVMHSKNRSLALDICQAVTELLSSTQYKNLQASILQNVGETLAGFADALMILKNYLTVELNTCLTRICLPSDLPEHIQTVVDKWSLHPFLEEINFVNICFCPANLLEPEPEMDSSSSGVVESLRRVQRSMASVFPSEKTLHDAIQVSADYISAAEATRRGSRVAEFRAVFQGVGDISVLRHHCQIDSTLLNPSNPELYGTYVRNFNKVFWQHYGAVFVSVEQFQGLCEGI